MATPGPADPAGGNPAQGNPAQGNPAQGNPAQNEPAQDDPVGERPRTPWAERFGVHSAGRWRIENSSGLHPDYPNIDPDKFGDLPPEADADKLEALEMPDDAALDKLFLDEAEQKSRLCGFPTYQAVVFNQNMPVDSDLRERIDESKWHPVFAKARWYNMDLPLEHEYPNPGRLLPGLLPNPTYNVDDPVFWQALQPGIQLASDILSISFNLPFNDAVRSVRRGQNIWRGARATGLVDQPHIADNPPEDKQTSVQDTYKWFMYNSKRIQISFMAPKVGYAKMGSAVTYPAPSGSGAIVMLINPSLIWVLLDSAATPAQKAHCAFALGTRLAHEMQHAAYRIEQFSLPEPQRMLNEAFYRPVRGGPTEWVAEFGMAFEKQVVGGFCRPGSGADDVLRQGFLTACEDFPNRLIAHNRGGVNLDDHQNEAFYSYLTPASLIVPYFKDNFWNQGLALYGLQVLKLPRILRVRGVFGQGFLDTEFLGEDDQKERQEELDFLKSGIKGRAEKWEVLRPWYRKNYDAWKASFWSLTSARNALARFVDAVRREDEYEAQEAIKDVSLNAHSQWPNAVRFGSLLGDAGDSFGWLRDALGFLMFAALPSRRQERVTEVGPNPEWSPGQENLKEVEAMGIEPFPIETQGSFDASQVLRTRHPPGNARGNRVALLDALQREFTAGRDVVSQVVSQSILSDFRVQMEALTQWANKNKNAEGVWGPFNFKLPAWTPPFREKKVGMEPRGDFEPKKYNGDAPIQPYAATVPGGQPPPPPPPPPRQPLGELGQQPAQQPAQLPARPGGQPPQQPPAQPGGGQAGRGQAGRGQPQNWRNSEWRGRGGQGRGWQNNSWQNRSQRRGGGQGGGGRGRGDGGRGGRGGGGRGGGGPRGGGGRGDGGRGGRAGRGRGGNCNPIGGGNRRAMMAGRAPTAYHNARPRLHTVGEVGDHRSADDLWLLVDAEGEGYDVYDATDAVEEVRSGQAPDGLLKSLASLAVSLKNEQSEPGHHLNGVVERTLSGLKAISPELIQQLKLGEPLGRILPTVRWQHVADRDGLQGRPLWAAVDGNVYDISDLGDERIRNLIRSNGGRVPAQELAALDGVNVDAVFRAITEDRCARLAELVHPQGPDPNAEMIFTEKEVACYIYPEEGIYTIIRGDVYDMTDFVESHPGGRNILKEWAGQESTEEFARYHRNADQCIEDYDYLRLGRVVEEVTPDQIADYEVAVNGMVYDLRPLWEWEDLPEDHPIFTEGVSDGYGTDISHRIRVPQPSEGILQLLNRRDLIVAKLSSVVDVYPDELAENDGSEAPLSEDDDDNAAALRPSLAPERRPAWVSCEGEVYDLTSVWKYGPADMKAWINQWRGKQVPPNDFTQRLAQDYRCRIFGRLMWGYDTRPPNLKRRADDDDDDHSGNDAYDPDRDDGRIKRGRVDWNGLAIVC